MVTDTLPSTGDDSGKCLDKAKFEGSGKTKQSPLTLVSFNFYVMDTSFNSTYNILSSVYRIQQEIRLPTLYLKS